MAKHLSHVFGTSAATAQSEPATPEQVKNNAGGYAFQVEDFSRLVRFLILGTEGSTYYVSEQKHTKDNAKVVERCIKADGIRTVKTIVEVSLTGRAPKNDYAVFALAMCASFGTPEVKAYALENLQKVCRTGTHLFMFTSFVEDMRKWSRGLRTAYRNWYLNRAPEKLALQLVKYQSRKIEGQPGWSHDDILRKAHVHAAEGTSQYEMFQWVTEGWDGFTDAGKAKVRYCTNLDELRKTRGKGVEKKYSTYELGFVENSPMRVIEGFERAKTERDPKKVAKLIREYGLTREMVPTEVMKSPEVWEALLENMPYTAMIRNLGNMAKAGILGPNSDASIKVMKALADGENLRKARVHPIKILAALLTYDTGRSTAGLRYGRTDATWTVNKQISNALDESFYLSFKYAPKTEKRYMIGQDISASMQSGVIAGIHGLTPAVGSACLGMAIAKIEPFLFWGGYGTQYYDLKVDKTWKLENVVKHISGLSFGGTDCAKPIQHAMKNKIPVDAFINLTDNETWAGPQHTHQALREYRQKTGINAKLIVVGMTATGFSIADPSDPGSMDVVGFDTNVPSFIADFVSDGKVALTTEEVSE